MDSPPQIAPDLVTTGCRSAADCAKGQLCCSTVCVDGASDAKRFAHKYGITYPIVHDAPGSVVDRYGVTGFPETFFVDRKGRLVGAHISGSILSTSEIKAEFTASIHRALQS